MSTSEKKDEGAARTQPAGNAARIAGWLGLAATPCFGLMALLAAINDGSGAICSATSTALAPDGMPVMYLLMSIVHLPPWLRLLQAHPLGRNSSAVHS